MSASVYKINKGINRPVVFKGLKAQFIGYLGIGVLVMLFLFAILYIAGVNMFLCLAIITVLGTAMFVLIYHLNDRYGQYGIMKLRAARRMPRSIRHASHSMFTRLLHT